MSGICLTAVLGLAMGSMGHAVGDSDHRDRESCIAAYRAIASGGRIIGRNKVSLRTRILKFKQIR